MSGFFNCTIDPATLAAARAGQRTAQEAIYREFATPVFTMAVRIVQQRDVAEEILQDTFYEVLRKLHTFRGDSPLGAWVRRIAVNKSLAYLRSGWHRYARPLDSAAEPRCEETAGPDEALVAALGQLKPVARAVVWLHDVEGYTHQEIAALMGKSPSFSKSQLSRAHRRLRELLTPERDQMPCMPALKNY